MQLNMPVPGEFTRLLTPDTRILSRGPPIYVTGEEPPIAVGDARQSDPLARLKPVDRMLFKEREMEFTGEPSLQQRKTREADQELYIQRQEEKILELEKTVKTLRKELSVARNNQRSFGTRSEDNEIARLKRRVAQLEYENNELRNGAYVSIDEGIGQRGAVQLYNSDQPELRAAQRTSARRASAPKSPEQPVRQRKEKGDKFAHIKPRVQTGLRQTDSPGVSESGDVVYAQQQHSPPRIMYREPMTLQSEYPRVTYSEPTYVGSAMPYEYGGYQSSGYVSGLPPYTRTVERIIDETPRVYSASRILGPESVLLE